MVSSLLDPTTNSETANPETEFAHFFFNRIVNEEEAK